MADRGSTSPNRSQNLERGVFSSISSINLYKSVIEERKQLHSNSLLNIKSTKSKTPIRTRLFPSPKLTDRAKSPETKPNPKLEEEVLKLQELVKKLQQQLLREKRLNEKLEEQVKDLSTKCKTDAQVAEKNLEKLNKVCNGLKSSVNSLTLERDSLSKISIAYTTLQEEFRFTVSSIIKEVTYYVESIDKDFQLKIMKTLKNSMSKFKIDFNDAVAQVECWSTDGKGQGGRDSIDFEADYYGDERGGESLASTKGFNGNFLDDVQNAVALYDFEKERDEDLEFFRGEMIEILEKNESGWWIGRIGDKIGTFPFNFVNII